MPETHDLDQLFDDLATQITRTSSPRGAHAAIRTARRRRAATGVGVVAGAAVLAVGIGVGFGFGLGESGLDGDSDRVPDVATNGTSLLPLPAPASLDAAAMDTATAGWLETGWQKQGSPVLADPPCFREGTRIPEPSGSSADELRLGRDVGAALTIVSFDAFADARTAFDALADPGTCADSVQRVPLAEGPVAATVLRVSDGGRGNLPSTFWVVRDGADLGLLTVAGPEESPSQQVAERVALATLAAVGDSDLGAE